MKYFKNFDFVILFSILIVSTFGLVMVWSLTPSLFNQQLVFLLVGLLLFFIVSGFDIRIFQNFSKIIYLFSIFFLFLTFILGEVTRGSIRWIPIGNYSIQPSEMVKPLLIIFFASLIAGWDKLKIPHLAAIFLLALIPLVLIFKQPDLGSSLIIAAVLTGILLGGGITKKPIAGFFVLILMIIPAFWFFLHDYQKSRFLSFLNPYNDPLGSGYNLIQAVIAVGSGELFGRGLGRGTQSHLAFLPERHTDFMFASLSEEFGLVGAAIVIMCYLILLFRVLKHAQNSHSKFASLVCLGVFSMLFFQIFVNIGMNMGIMPITGIPLPFVSYGGSSALATMICFGLVEAAGKFEKNQEVVEIK
ncbi:rod shape-determining protein RodA [Candidatus Shapirobacteria bacterium CG08_land_8_20_14_0_20_39_18]|uniref:Rod shape-determining protein RodA n=1 Tax=Candidatus Shapirobacteria bacterium CG08_land_8_20_14_0_20_39_18 TaxID=1974883 RepID=A0A2M6XBW0_9BACT|nr:MAG: rod shape-determining protein RodA [Candidatus Shapirobacteria bacterium CG08_land_8_20_14_0_20_39_18]PIY65336.1 MAG: rod shape-determining protein RodA [Candidatus Shapirobacteria bacterium CG_4_10_14_0_8_um_filter_39_15]PJE68489.1 MAG: rod shape-determining protein RodA [Candidatus Shapirobacteria bacterium CG10_big_fil_rev_8_21_14_0_10_38_8]